MAGKYIPSSRIVRETSGRKVYEGSDHLYKLHIDRMSFNPFLGKGNLTGVRLDIDTTQRAMLEKNNKSPALTLAGNLENSSIQGVNVLKWWCMIGWKSTK
ncbi:MAG: hypothetical protein QM669_06350 [Siphonobacter sp.]